MFFPDSRKLLDIINEVRREAEEGVNTKNETQKLLEILENSKNYGCAVSYSKDATHAGKTNVKAYGYFNNILKFKTPAGIYGYPLHVPEIYGQIITNTPPFPEKEDRLFKYKR